MWVVQLVGLGVFVYALRLEAMSPEPLPTFVWGVLAAVVLPPELLRLILSRFKG